MMVSTASSLMRVSGLLALIVGCSFDGGGVGASAVEAGGGSSGGTSTGESGTGPAPTSEGSGTGSSGCMSGSTQACDCTDGEGLQTCVGGGFGPCACPESTGPATTADDTTTTGVDPSTTTTDPSSTTTDPSTSSTTEAACEQKDVEPNDDPMENAILHSEAVCNAPEQVIAGTLADPDDIDFHYYPANDTAPTNCNPGTITVEHRITADALVRMCVLPICANEVAADVDCFNGFEFVQPAPGCCLDAAGGTLTFDLDCQGVDSEDSALVVWVENAGEACVDYTIEYDIGT